MTTARLDRPLKRNVLARVRISLTSLTLSNARRLRLARQHDETDQWKGELMPQESIYFDEQTESKRVQVLKVYDAAYTRSCFEEMGGCARVPVQVTGPWQQV